jgi:hypothetical protein
VLGALFRKVQGGSCQNSIGSPKFFEDREVICFYDRNQLTGEMRLSPISVEVSLEAIIAGSSLVPYVIDSGLFTPGNRIEESV